MARDPDHQHYRGVTLCWGLVDAEQATDCHRMLTLPKNASLQRRIMALSHPSSASTCTSGQNPRVHDT